MRRLFVVTLVASILMVAAPERASACSCALLDPATALEESEAAFIGTLVERPTEMNGPAGTAVWVFEVDDWVKGDLGETVGVHSGLGGGDCGFEMEEGDQTAVFLRNDNGRPAGGLCSVTTPDAMRAATRPLVLDGEGRPVFLLSGGPGRARLVTLDAAGRMLAAVGDDRHGWSVSICPNGDLVAEVVEGEVIVRDSVALNPVRTASSEGSVQKVWCLDPKAERLLGEIRDDSGGNPRLVFLDHPGEPLHTGEVAHLEVGHTHAVVIDDPVGGAIQLIDLQSGDRTRLAGGGDVSVVSLSPDGRRLLVSRANHHPQGGWTAFITVYDVSNGQAIFTSPGLVDTEVRGWIDNLRIAIGFYPIEADAPDPRILDITDGSVAESEMVGWDFHPVGDLVASVESGTLYVTPPGQPSVALASLPSPSHRLVGVLAADASVTLPDVTTPTTDNAAVEAVPSNEEASFPASVAFAALAGVAAIVLAGWTAIRRRRPS